MKYDFPYKEGDEVSLFKDYQTEEECLGTAKLIKFVRFGRSFILEDMMPEHTQVVYSFQEWLTSMSDKPYKIRFIEAIGITNSADDDTEIIDEKLLKDSFIIWDGKEIY